MGLTTSPNDIPYPEGSDPVTLALYFAALALAAQASLPVFSATEPTKKPGLVWYDPTDGTTKITDGSAWSYVMGPNVDTVTSGVLTAASGVTTITTQQFKKRNGIVYLRVNMVLLAALAAGNIANTTLCTVIDPRFTPLPDFTSYTLSSSDNGDMAAGVITPTGLIQVTATVRAFSVGDNISFGGSYPAAN